MEFFKETLEEILPERSVVIARSLIEEMPVKKKLDLSRFDFDRVEWADQRDPRTIKGSCQGQHAIQGFGRGSKSGTNKHGLWLVCSTCQVRLMYLPAIGAPAVYRSAGPVAADVQKHLDQLSTNDVPNPKDLGTKALGYAAAEASTLRHLEHIRSQQAKLKKESGAPKAAAKSSAATPSSRKSTRLEEDQRMSHTKRENHKTPEQQEVEVVGDSPPSEWKTISP